MKKIVKKIVVLTCGICLTTALNAQIEDIEPTPVEKLSQRTDVLESALKTLQKFKVSGYIQTQFQYAEAAADGNNFKLANRANLYESSALYPAGTDNYKGLDGYGRFGIRRGRIKFVYEEGIASGVVQLDITDKGISGDRNTVVFKDLYLNVKDPWFGTNAFKAGIFDRPFGYEIAHSSSRRESPERARIIQSLFPDERDLGAMLTLQAPKTSPWNFLKFEGGLFAGSGIKPQFTSQMDFIGRLSATKLIGDNILVGGGVSLYAGGVFQNDSAVYVMSDKRFVRESYAFGNIGKRATRRYLGFDAQVCLTTAAGMTQLRGEYIFGEHPGNAGGAYDFKFNVTGNGQLPGALNGPVFMRKISGGYVILVQDLGTTPLSAVMKYDFYDPNTGAAGNDIAAAETVKNPTERKTVAGAGDLAMSNLGFGLLWRINSALKLTAYYDIVKNEKTKNSADKTVSASDARITSYGWANDRPDNVFTLRLQYKF